MKYFLISTFLLCITSCTKEEKAANLKEIKVVEQHQHSHTAPNGGILTELPDHSACLEWLIEDGIFKVFIFDGCAENPIRLSQLELKVNINNSENKLTLLPETNKLSGEKPGDSNTFSIATPKLTKAQVSDVNVQFISIKGIDYENVNLKVK